MTDEFFGRKNPAAAFERRERAAIKGRHFPTPVELVLGMVFFRDSFDSDLAEFAARLRRSAGERPGHDTLAALLSCIDEVEAGASVDSIARLRDSLGAAESATGLFAAPSLLRCRFYMAWLGSRGAALDLACDAVTMVLSNEAAGEVERRLFWRVLDFVLVGARFAGFSYLGPGERLRQDDGSSQRLEAFDFDFGPIARRALGIAEAGKRVDSFPDRSAQSGEHRAEDGSSSGRTVLAGIGSWNSEVGALIAERYRHIVGRTLPVVTARSPAAMERELVTQFPHATGAVTQVLKGFGTAGFAAFEPTVLVGPPGSGKTRLARRLMEVAGLRSAVIPCGGMSDSAIGGTARKWHSGETSLPMQLITGFAAASFGIVLDEIDKVGSSRTNGQAHDALLVFLEPETASRFFDPFLQAECDLSAVSWIMTANDADLLPRSLLDRSRVVRLPAPDAGHLDRLAALVLGDILAASGQDARWAGSFNPDEMAALRANWQGGSLRLLRRMVEVIVEQRQSPEQQS